MVSRDGWPDQIGSDHTVGTLEQAALLHSGRPTVVTVGMDKSEKVIQSL